MEQIDSGQIHLWLACPGEVTDPDLLAEYRSLLSEEELRRQARFHFERDRHRYLVTRAMVRTTLSKYVNIAPWKWRFSVNAYGKPAIAAQHATARGIEFNISHTHGLVAMGVTYKRAIGVDVENMCAREIDIEIAERYFATTEVAALLALRPERRQQRFFEHWTLKESYIKARGMGLAIPLDRFAFHLDDRPRIRLTMDPSLGDRPERWTFWQLRLGREDLAALCAEHVGPAPLLAARRWP